jgi:LlaJI restriction endonuclease.
MIFLFEQFAYSEKFLQDVLPQEKKGGNWDLPKGFVTKSKSGDFVLDGVGYLYNKSAKGSAKNSDDKIVFVLPKVFLEEGGKAFGKDVKGDANFALENAPKDFLANLSMWVCSSIAQYQKLHPNDRAIESPNVHRFGSDAAAPTLIDVMNAMKLFYAENKNLFVFTAKNKHSGNNRIDWRRTVAHTQPFMQGDTPIYMDLENKKKVFDLDDRLLVLYFSAMHYIEETFGFKMPHSEFYVPMRVNEFRRLLGHRGLVELRRIKHKYFADKFLKLYNIVKAFFEWGGNFSASDYSSEYLLTSKYNNVFEAMIDKLVGDESRDIDSLKQNDDGKIIDHLYKEKSLVFASGTDDDLIWHIGDSKYYKEDNDLEPKSIAKQYTYAKNIVQDFFSPDYVEKETDKDADNAKLHEKDIHKGVRYRDPLTEGYSITPNFFLRGELPPYENRSQFQESYFRAEIDPKDSKLINIDSQDLWDKRNRHFKNRLFDRDTLLLQVYNVNFLYVLKAYTSKRSSLRDEFKRDAREKFRRNFLSLLREKYYFWALYLPNWESADYKDRLEKFVNDNFRKLVGRVFRSEATPKCLILALERDVVDNSEDGADDDYRKIREIVDGNNCDVFSLLPEEIWGDGQIRRDDMYGWRMPQ